jgi:hypothetical protein
LDMARPESTQTLAAFQYIGAPMVDSLASMVPWTRAAAAAKR